MKRWLVVALVLLIALPLGGALLLRYLLSPAMLKRAIERQGSAYLGHQVTVGSARARLLPTAGVELDDVTVTGPVALDVDQVIVRANLRSLLDRRVEDAVLHVSGGRVTLAEAAEAEPAGDRGDAGAPPATGESEPGEGGFTIASVREIVLEDVTIAGGGRELRIDLEGALDGDRVEVSRLAASSGQTSLEASGVISSLEKREGDFRVTSPMVNLDEVLAVVGAFLPAGNGAPAAPGADRSTGVGRVTATLEVDKGRALGYEIDNLRTTAVVTGTTIEADPLTFELYGGRYESRLSLTLNETTALAHGGTLQGADVATLASLFGHSGAATGTLGMQMAVSGTGQDFAGAASRATGSANVELTDGTIAGLDVVRSTFVLLGASPPERGQGERYERITARLGVDRGWLRADDFVLHSPDFDLMGQVTVAPDGRLQGHVDLVLSEALSKEAQSRNRDLDLTFEDSRITLPAVVGGSLASPTVLPDLQAALTRAARRRIEEEVDEAKKKAVDQIRKGLERLIPRPK
ncbi:MAG TPA: AsmA-like C-terminal region-containing protein [Methylomirabilota bacterium]